MYLNHETWLSKIASAAQNSSKIGNLWISSADHPQDESTSRLQDAKSLGYTTIEWIAGAGSCELCKVHDHHTWTIDDFLANLVHNAPVFERSHVGDRSCHLELTGPDLEKIVIGPYPF